MNAVCSSRFPLLYRTYAKHSLSIAVYICLHNFVTEKRWQRVSLVQRFWSLSIPFRFVFIVAYQFPKSFTASSLRRILWIKIFAFEMAKSLIKCKNIKTPFFSLLSAVVIGKRKFWATKRSCFWHVLHENGRKGAMLARRTSCKCNSISKNVSPAIATSYSLVFGVANLNMKNICWKQNCSSFKICATKCFCIIIIDNEYNRNVFVIQFEIANCMKISN